VSGRGNIIYVVSVMTIARFDMVFVLGDVVVHEEEADRRAACVIQPETPTKLVVIRCLHSFPS
jgi:hypothetical protein